MSSAPGKARGPNRKAPIMLTILLIVVILLLLFGGFGYSRRGRV
jgi:flagellar basal body-associated protein FliL